MSRKPRSDGELAQLRTIAKSNKDTSWPGVVPPAVDDKVREMELDTYEKLIATRSPEDWTDLDLVNAARYAGHLAQQIKDEDMLKRSGSLIQSPKNPKHYLRNPLIDVLSSRQATINQLSRQLGVSLPAMDREAMINNAKNANALDASGEPNYLSLLAGSK